MVRIKEVEDDTGVTYPHPSSRRRRPQAAVPAESGFVLILVLPVAMLLMMTALSLVTRSNSAAIASVNESRAQAARMAAEYGLNELMARINIESDSSKSPLLFVKSDSLKPDIPIAGSPTATYTILLNPPLPSTVVSCNTPPYSDLNVTIMSTLTVGSSINNGERTRTLSICALPTANKLRVRAMK